MSRPRYGADLDFGPFALHDLPFLGIPGSTMPCPEHFAEVGLHGAIGTDLFRHFVVAIDSGSRTVRFEDAASYTPVGTTLPLQVAQGHLFTRVLVTLADGTSGSGLVDIDTGFNGSLSLLDGALFKAPPGATSGTFCQVDGLDHTTTAQPSMVVFGERCTNVETVFSHGAPMIPDHVGTVGMGFLRRFVLVFDYSRNTLELGAVLGG